MIEVPNKPITHAYFVETGVVSVVAVNAEDHRIEVGVIGYEGMTGVPLIMGDDRAQHSTYMQIGGSGHRIPRPTLLSRAMRQSESLRALMLKSAQGFMIQTAHTALANGRAKLEERLARWLLMAHDRLNSDAVPLTHEFLAVMLGVRRAGVTVALHCFERRGLITTRRGQLTLVNRAGIEQVAGSFYGMPEAELKRLMSEQQSRNSSPFAGAVHGKIPHAARHFSGLVRRPRLAAAPASAGAGGAAQRGESVLLVAPTGGGKTLAGFLPSLIDLADTAQSARRAAPRCTRSTSRRSRRWRWMWRAIWKRRSRRWTWP